MIRLLGPVEVWGSAGKVAVGGKDALFLAELVLHRGSAVSHTHLAEALWGERPPRDPANAVHVRASRLRGLLRAADASGTSLVRVQAGSYALAGDALRSDLAEFEQEAADAAEAEAAGERTRALAHAERAERTWRGEPVGGALLDLCLAAQADRLAELRLSATQAALSAQLALGRADAAVRTAVPLLARYPFHEGLHALAMRALAQAGRPGEALVCYAALRERLVHELGTEPGPELRTLHARLLRNGTRRRDRDGGVDGGMDRGMGRGTDRGMGRGMERGTDRGTDRGAEGGAEGVGSWLPQGPSLFAGRRDALGEIRRALVDDRAVSGEVSRAARAAGAGSGAGTVVVSGMPGVGKTALAVEAARALREEFPDGRILVRAGGGLRARDAGAREGQPTPGEVREILSRTRTLVILDDVRSAAQLRQLIPANARGAVLITSQSRLSAWDAGARIGLRPLDPDESPALLPHTAGRGRPGDGRAVREIAELCGHLPLALRVVAARLASAAANSEQALAERLAERRERLSLLEFDDLSVRATLLRPLWRLTRSGHRSEREAAAALRRLAADGSGAWPAASAVRLLETGPRRAATDPRDALDLLVESSLLDLVDGNLLLHPLLRDAAAEQSRSVAAVTADRQCAGFLQARRAQLPSAGIIRSQRLRVRSGQRF